MEGRAPNLQQTQGSPLSPASSAITTVARRKQPGWRGPVLTKPTGAGAGKHGPAGPEAPAGVQGVGKRRWSAPAIAQAHSRRGGESGAAKRLQSRRADDACAASERTRWAHARPSCRGREVSPLRKSRPSGFFRRPRAPFGKKRDGAERTEARLSAATHQCPAPPPRPLTSSRTGRPARSTHALYVHTEP